MTDLLSFTLAARMVDMPSIHLRHPAAKGRVADRPVRAWHRFSLLPKNVTPATPARSAAVVMFRNRTAARASSGGLQFRVQPTRVCRDVSPSTGGIRSDVSAGAARDSSNV